MQRLEQDRVGGSNRVVRQPRRVSHSVQTRQLLNQSVLLKGINDSADILSELSEKLFSVGVLPYYCHLLDPVQGAAHFDVEKLAAEQIEAELKAKLPGYLVPKFVREVPHARSKISISDLN